MRLNFHLSKRQAIYNVKLKPLPKKKIAIPTESKTLAVAPIMAVALITILARV